MRSANIHAQQLDDNTLISPYPLSVTEIDNVTQIQNQYTKTYDTRIGNLTTQFGYVTNETANKLNDELFFQTAIQVYLLALPAVGGAGIFNGVDKIDANSMDLVYWSQLMTSDFGLLTPNTSTLYFMSFLDLSDGPIVFKIPANLQGAVNNIYQQPVVDLGKAGPDKGMGGTYLLIPPHYNGTIPENYFIAKSDTTQNLVIGRAFLDDTKNTTSAVNSIKEFRAYHLSEADNPPNQKMIDASGHQLKLSHPTTDGFWEFLHKVYSKEKYVRDEDKNLIGMMKIIGIDPTQPFAPDEHSKKLLDEAAIVANLMAKNIAYNSPIKSSWIYYPDKTWELGFMTTSPAFEDERNATQILPRLSFAYQAITTANNMIKDYIGSGSKYLMNYRDGNDNFLVGSNTYRLHIPPNVPVKQFWSIDLYDTETRALLKNDVQPRPSVTSANIGNVTQNDDGSYDIYLGPTAPAGQEKNWLKTNVDEGFFVIFRFYGPTEEYYSKSWQLPDFELIKGDMKIH